MILHSHNALFILHYLHFMVVLTPPFTHLAPSNYRVRLPSLRHCTVVSTWSHIVHFTHSLLYPPHNRPPLLLPSPPTQTHPHRLETISLSSVIESPHRHRMIWTCTRDWYYTYIPTHKRRNRRPKPLKTDATSATESSLKMSLVNLVEVTSYTKNQAMKKMPMPSRTRERWGNIAGLTGLT